jgi:ATP-dependent Lon protease
LIYYIGIFSMAKVIHDNTIVPIITPQTAIKRSNGRIKKDISKNEKINSTHNPICDNNEDIIKLVGKNIAANLTKSEERRLKADIKRGYDIRESRVLRDMLKRCPHLEAEIMKILNSTNGVEKDIEKDNGKRKINITKEENSKKRKVITTKTSNKIDKTPRFSKTINDWVEDLGGEDTTDEDSKSGSDNEYVDDDFVVNEDDDDIIAEVNDLNNDIINHSLIEGRHSTSNKKVAEEVHKKIQELREKNEESKIDITKISMSNFSNDDSVWFYKNIKRLSHLDGKDRFDLEDKIEQRYKLLKTLQASNLYKTFKKGAERDMTKEILESKHPDNVKSILLNKLYNVMDSSTDEYQKILNWMDIVLSLPININSVKQDIKTSMNLLYKNLHENLYGMDDVIQQVLQAVCTILTDPNNNGYILTLVGPPGVGKTTISTLIANAIGMGFGQVSCGSINDQSTIVGHGSTYIGSKPGIFTQCLINNGQLDNVILLDELDKLYDEKMIPILLHVLDRTQNNRFKDAFCPEIDIDLSKNLFIVAVNSLESFDEALKDRLKVVTVNGYDSEQKINICIKHLIPKLIKKTKINLSIDANTVRTCVEKISPDISGVRDLERFFGDIYEKLLLLSYMGPEFFNLPKTFNMNALKKIDVDLIKHLTGI